MRKHNCGGSPQQDTPFPRAHDCDETERTLFAVLCLGSTHNLVVLAVPLPFKAFGAK